jgi:hypothetical protein
VETEYLPELVPAAGKEARRIVELLSARRASVDLGGRERALARAIAELHRSKLSKAERSFYRTHLSYGGTDDATGGRQRQLAELLEGTLKDGHFFWSPLQVRDLGRTARKHGPEWGGLADWLDRVAAYEPVLAPASDLYFHLLGCHDTPATEVVTRLRSAWGPRVKSVAPEDFRSLRTDLQASDGPLVNGWIAIAETMATGAYDQLLGLLLEQNRAVTALRGGAPWVVQAGGKLSVRYQAETGDLPAKEDLPTLWRNPYFLDSLRSVVGTIDGGRA